MPNPGDSELTARARRLTMGRNAPKAGRALGQLGREAIPALEAALTHTNPFVRSGALHGFAAVTPSGPDLHAAIVGALTKDPDARVRETACFVLGQLGGEALATAHALLDRVRTEDLDSRVRAAASAALANP